jgi:hypothetical protein
MATCEKCGENFKPYWRLTDVQDKKCEKCEYVGDKQKEKRIWNALIQIVIGFIIIIMNPEALSLPLELIGFVLVLFGTVKMIEDAMMHRGIRFEGSQK